MATVHVYVRTQVTGSDADVKGIAAAVEALRKTVTAAKGPWNGSATVELDPVPEGEHAATVPADDAKPVA
jgi:hypothetical protein